MSTLEQRARGWLTERKANTSATPFWIEWISELNADFARLMLKEAAEIAEKADDGECPECYGCGFMIAKEIRKLAE